MCCVVVRGIAVPEAHGRPRFHCPPATQNYGNGFRVARDVATIPIGDTAGESRTFSECDISLRWCPPGTFNLGSSQASMERLEDQDDTSGPGGNTVTIEFHRGFWIQESEVTQGLWQKVMNSQPWEADKDVPAGSDFPATFVSWEDSLDFCRTLTEQERTAGTLPSGFEYRLPTEAEWEYACRAGTNTRYYFGDDQSVLSEHAWWAENLQPNPMLQEVNQKPANAWGLRDVCGNVCEWCVDVYQDHLNSDGSPNTGDVTMNHVLRGGSFLSNHIFCMSATRYAFQGNVRANSLGLRIVLVPALAQKNVDNRPTTVLSETATNLQAPIQLSPKDGAFLGNRPQKNIMTWTPVAGATLYRVQIQFIVGANGELGPACDFESTTDRFENDLNGNRPKRWRVGTASGQTTAWSN